MLHLKYTLCMRHSNSAWHCTLTTFNFGWDRRTFLWSSCMKWFHRSLWMHSKKSIENDKWCMVINQLSIKLILLQAYHCISSTRNFPAHLHNYLTDKYERSQQREWQQEYHATLCTLLHNKLSAHWDGMWKIMILPDFTLLCHLNWIVSIFFVGQ